MFGRFDSVAVTEQGKMFFDPGIFVFSFESHGRCETPQRFAVKEGLRKEAFVFFDERDDNGFVWFAVDGAGYFLLGNENIKSYCLSLSHVFDGIQNKTLTGKNYGKHHCTRLDALQLR